VADANGIIEWVLRQEDATLGGKVEQLEDGAGLTRFGITSRWDYKLVSPDFFTEPSDVALQNAKSAYRAAYWNYIHGDDIEPDEVAASIFSFAVNAGAKTSVILAQRALDLEPDGVVGQHTLIALREPGAGDAIRAAQANHYKAIVAKDPSKQRFLVGWLRRAARVYPSLEGIV